MAKSSKKDLQAKKRAKRREALKPVLMQPWAGIDLSAWFDTSFLAAAGADEEGGGWLSENGWYEDDVPGEGSLTWWAVTHPGDQQEAEAARLAVSLELARKKAGQDAGAEAEAHYAELLAASLPKLAELAGEGVVTANAVLGSWYRQGVNVGKNARKAKKHLLFAAEKGEPCSAFFLADDNSFPDRTDEFLKTSRGCGCLFAWTRQGLEYMLDQDLPDDELETLASFLAAYAVRKVYVCLTTLLRILEMPEGEDLRETYAPPMLDLLRQAAASGHAGAIERLGCVLTDGILCERNEKKGREAFREAMQRGSASSACLYAIMLVEEALRLPQPEQKAKLQESYAILRENCQEGRYPEKAYTALGCYLIRSDDEAEFKEGMACLKKSLVYQDFEITMECASYLVMEQPSPKRRAQGLKLLDRMVKAGSLDALYFKGCYTLMGMYGKEARKEGIDLLLKAAEEGDERAWAALAETYAFGLYGFRANTRKALSMAIEGDKSGSESAHFWRVLLEVGELSKASKSIADLVRDPQTSARELAGLIGRSKDAATNIHDRMIWLDASDLRSKILPYYPLPEKPHPAEDLEMLIDDGIWNAEFCVYALKHGHVPTVAFAVHALKKISQTEYSRFYMGALAVRLGMPYASDTRVFQYLKDYLQGLPESFFEFRDKEEDPDLQKKLAQWTDHMHIFCDPDPYNEHGFWDDDEDDDDEDGDFYDDDDE